MQDWAVQKLLSTRVIGGYTEEPLGTNGCYVGQTWMEHHHIIYRIGEQDRSPKLLKLLLGKHSMPS